MAHDHPGAGGTSQFCAHDDHDHHVLGACDHDDHVLGARDFDYHVAGGPQ